MTEIGVMMKVDELPRHFRERNMHFIDGAWAEPSSGQWFDAINPSTGSAFAQIAKGNAADVDRAVAAARAALNGPWGTFTPAQRQRALLKLADLLEAEFADLATIDAMEMGRPITPGRTVGDIIVRSLRHHAGLATAIHGYTPVNSAAADLTSLVVREPIGVVGVIMPWNGPIFCSAWKCGPALAAGCTVVIKPSGRGSLSPLRFAELCMEAGFPAGVVNVVTGNAEVGEAIASHPGIDKITFTGSSGVGQRIIALAAPTVKAVTMELGGKSPNIIFADANLDIAVPAAASAAFNNSGQVCSAGSRIFVERPIYDEFVERLCAWARNMVIGNSLDPSVQLGPLVSERQYDTVCSYLASGQEDGAILHLGGAPLTDGAFGNGYFVPPTIFGEVTDSMRIATDEIFGPVACLMPFDSFEEVIARANSTPFGLAGAVWTRDIGKALRAVKAIKAGTLWVNHYHTMDPAVPFGGYKLSGIGREGGFEHLESYLQTKSIWIRNDI